MQVTNKQQILKLLNLDALIDQYMREPRRIQRQPGKSNVNIKNKKNNQYPSSSKLTSTLPVASNNSDKRSCSVKNIQRKTIDDSLTTKDYNSFVRTCSSRLNQRGGKKFTEPHDQQTNTQSVKKNYNSTRVISKVINSFIQKQPSELKQANQPQINKSKNLNDIKNQQNTNETIEVLQNSSIKIKTDVIKKQKVKLRVPKFDFEYKCEKKIALLKGRYQLEKLIGRGLSGQVFRAKDILSDRHVAIKIIDINNVEYQFIKRLQHQNMISYYNSFLQNGKRYIVLQYLPQSLAEVVRKRKLTQNQIKKVFKSIASGLLYLHSLSYAHRDIKLDNIVASDDLQIIKFIDFGLCVDTAQSSQKQMKRFCGTTSYMAPQVISGKCIQPKNADIWSLGVALYILSVGRVPFTGRQQMQIFTKIKNNKTLFPPQMSQSLRDLLSSMLSKKPEDRPSIYEIVNHEWLDA